MNKKVDKRLKLIVFFGVIVVAVAAIGNELYKKHQLSEEVKKEDQQIEKFLVWREK